MSKAPKADSSRRPPKPSSSHAEIDEWIRGVRPDLNPIVSHLDSSIRRAVPKAHYAIKWNKAYYGLPRLGWIIEIVAYNVSVNIVFLGGSAFDDPPALGSGRSRYVKLRTLEEAKAPEIQAWIKQAARVSGWM